jgi:hypothetical protein
MTALPKTVDAILGTIQDVRYIDSLEAANANDPAALTPSNRIYNFLEAWTEASYEAWEKSGRQNNF